MDCAPHPSGLWQTKWDGALRQLAREAVKGDFIRVAGAAPSAVNMPDDEVIVAPPFAGQAQANSLRRRLPANPDKLSKFARRYPLGVNHRHRTTVEQVKRALRDG